MFAAVKVAFLFIGTSIGAGFSSGREIALFFKGASPWCVALAGVFIAVLGALFLIAGKTDAVPQNRLVKTGVFMSAFISLCSMLAGGEYILGTLFGVPLLGLIMGVVGAAVVVFGIEKIKWANTLLIPLLVALMLTVYLRDGAPVYDGKFSLLQPLRYSGLDVLLGGIMLSREGKKMSYKQIAVTSVSIGIFMFGLLFMLQNIVLSDEIGSTMPVLGVAESVGLKTACGVLIAIAIFTTLIGALEIVTAYTQNFFINTKKTAVIGKEENRTLVVLGALTVAYPFSFAGFENIVDTCYPFISLCGVVFVVWTVILLIKKKLDKSGKLKRPRRRLRFRQPRLRPLSAD